MRRLISILVLASALPLLTSTTANAADDPCAESIGLGEVGLQCSMSQDEARSRIRAGSQGPAPTHSYKLERACVATTEGQGPDCTHQPCSQVEGGHYYALFESLIAADPPTWVLLGYVCLADPNELLGPTVEDVQTAFREMDWPAATLNVQPADGETLVNLPTVFHADNNDPITQTINLLGQTVVIEATPVEWTWHWAQRSDDATADDVLPHTTSHPGAPHPDATITHTYRTSGMTVRPSVDVTYQGRYRLNNGPWQDIPDPHTVPGPATEPLTILEARPALVP